MDETPQEQGATEALGKSHDPISSSVFLWILRKGLFYKGSWQGEQLSLGPHPEFPQVLAEPGVQALQNLQQDLCSGC